MAQHVIRSRLAFCHRCILASLLIVAGACRHDVIETPGAVSPLPTAERREAGAAKVDITPPPGPGPFGFSDAAEHGSFVGHRTRLFARAIVIDDPVGGKIGLVALDLGCASFMLLRRVANRVAVIGLSADRILLAATHTHSAPAGHHGAPFYDRFGSPGLLTGFDQTLADWLADRIALALREADAAREPATVRVGIGRVDELTKNRSVDAYRANEGTAGQPAIDPRLTVIRVDRATGDHANTPLATFTLFAGHPTVLGIDNDLWHGDVHGIAAFWLERRLQSAFDAPCVCAFANGALGDVSFRWREQTHDEALRLGRALTDRAADAVRSLDRAVDANPVRHGYLETVVRDAPTADGRTAAAGRMGIPTLGGAEDGRSGFYDTRFLFVGPRVVEGNRHERPRGEQGRKRIPLGCLFGLLADADGIPSIAALQTIRLGDVVLCGIPFEATTMIGRRIADAVANATGLPADRVVPVAPANGYLGYATTAEEYAAQHYEGSSTLYGPRTGVFLRERFRRVANAMREGDRATAPGRRFRVATKRSTVPPPGRGFVARKSLGIHQASGAVSLAWEGLDPGRIKPEYGWIVRVERQDTNGHWRPFHGPSGPADDTGLSFAVEVRAARRSRARWRATWFPAEDIDRTRRYRFALAPRPDTTAFVSDAFTLVAPPPEGP